ncbi:MAG: tetratricopeptide repeat protein [Salinivirgaceae bacterium]
MKNAKYLFIFLLFGLPNWLLSQESTYNTLLITKAYNKSNQAHKVLDLLNTANQELSLELLYEKGKAYYQTGNIKEAANCFYQLNEKEPNKAAIDLARCYALLNKPEFACNQIEAHLKQKERLMQHQIKSDTAFRGIENSECWNALWKTDWYNKYELMYEDALYEFNNQRYEDALNLINELIQIRKTQYQAYGLKALIYEKLGEYQLGLTTIEQAVAVRPKNAEFHAIKAQLELHLNKVSKALKSIDKALELDNTQIDYYFLKTKALAEKGKSKQAFESISFLTEIYPETKVFVLAASVYSQANEYQLAIKAMNKCIAMEKYNHEFYKKRGDLYLVTQLYDFAIKDFTMCLDFTPLDGELFFKRGLARLALKQNDEACSDFNKAYYYQYMEAYDYLSSHCRNYNQN